MRAIYAILTAVVLTSLSGAAFAGNLSLSTGKSLWQSTGCTEPTPPPSLLAADKESHAGSMNKLMENYNAYSMNMQNYMNCISKEAEADSEIANQTISRDAQVEIGAAQKKVADIHDALQPKK